MSVRKAFFSNMKLRLKASTDLFCSVIFLWIKWTSDYCHHHQATSPNSSKIVVEGDMQWIKRGSQQPVTSQLEPVWLTTLLGQHRVEPIDNQLSTCGPNGLGLNAAESELFQFKV